MKAAFSSLPDLALTIDVLALFAALATYFAWEIGRRGWGLREVSPLVKFIALGMAGAISFLVKAHAPLQPTTKYAVMGLWCVLLALAAGWLFAADFAKRAEGSLSWRLVCSWLGEALIFIWAGAIVLYGLEHLADIEVLKGVSVFWVVPILVIGVLGAAWGVSLGRERWDERKRSGKKG